MKALNFILLKVLFFLLAITVLNSQAKNEFVFTNHIGKRKTKVIVSEETADGRNRLRVETMTSPDNGGGTIFFKWHADVNPDGFWSLSGVGNERESLEFSVLTRSLLVEHTQPGRAGSVHVLLPFVYLYDQTISVRGEFRNVTINNAPNNQDNSSFILEGYLTVAREIELRLAAPMSIPATVEVAFNPDNDQLTRFRIRTAESDGVNFTGGLILSASSEQGADRQDEQPASSDSEQVTGDNQDEDGMTDNQPDDSHTLPIDIPGAGQNPADGLPNRTPADQLNSRAGVYVFGSAGSGAEGVGDTNVK